MLYILPGSAEYQHAVMYSMSKVFFSFYTKAAKIHFFFKLGEYTVWYSTANFM